MAELFEQEKRSKSHGAQARTCKLVFEKEGVNTGTVKKALQNAVKLKHERYRDGAVTQPKKKGKVKNPPNNIFNIERNNADSPN